MVLKSWINNRKEKKETRKRFEKLSDTEIQKLNLAEKKAYLSVAKKQVTYRGKINAYKDFPVNDADKIEIDKLVDDIEDEEDEEIGKVIEDELNDEVKKNGFPNIR